MGQWNQPPVQSPQQFQQPQQQQPQQFQQPQYPPQQFQQPQYPPQQFQQPQQAPFIPGGVPAPAPAFGGRPVGSSFAGIESAKASRQSNWARPGHYISRINRIGETVSRKSGTLFIVEMTVIAVIDQMLPYHAPGIVAGYKGSIPHIVGEDFAWSCSTKNMDTYLSNVKGFVERVVGAPPEAVTPQLMAMLCADNQPLAGTTVEHKMNTILTRTTQLPFCPMTWIGEVPPETVLAKLSHVDKERFYPNQFLERMIAKAGRTVPAAAAPAAAPMAPAAPQAVPGFGQPQQAPNGYAPMQPVQQAPAAFGQPQQAPGFH